MLHGFPYVVVDVVAAAWSPKPRPVSGRVQRYHEGGNNKKFTLEIMKVNAV